MMILIGVIFGMTLLVGVVLWWANKPLKAPTFSTKEMLATLELANSIKDDVLRQRVVNKACGLLHPDEDA